MRVVCTLASGSGGNAVLIGSGHTYILVDAGISAKRIHRALWELGLSIENIVSVLVTHEHSDHIAGVPALRKNIYAPPLTAQAVRMRASFCRVEEITGAFAVGDINVTPFDTPHDAPDSLGFSFDLGGTRVVLCTDLGHVTQAVMQHAAQADCLLIESNHDEAMLRAGPYPAFLKKRILGPRGHLSNEASAEVTAAAVCGGARHVALCHLSRENNRPELAERVTARRLAECGVTPGRDITLGAAPAAGIYRVM